MLSRDRTEGELVIHRLSRLFPNRAEFQDFAMDPSVGRCLQNGHSIHDVVIKRVKYISRALLDTTSKRIQRSIQTYIDMHIPLINARMVDTDDLSDVYARRLAPEQNTEYPLYYTYYKRWHANVVHVWHPSPDKIKNTVEITKFLSKGGHMPPSARHIADHMVLASKDRVLQPLVRDVLLSALLAVLPEDAVPTDDNYMRRCELYAMSTEHLCLEYIDGKTSRNIVDTISRFISGCTYQSSVLVRSLKQCPIKYTHYLAGLQPYIGHISRRKRVRDVQRFSCALVFDALCTELNTSRKLPGRVTSSLNVDEISAVVQLVLAGPPGACVHKELLLRAGCSEHAVSVAFRAILPINILFRTKGIKVKLPVLSDRDWSILFICVKTQQRRLTVRVECAGSGQIKRRSPVYTNICANCFTFRSLIPNLVRITKRTIGVVSSIDTAGTPVMACNSCKLFSVFSVNMASQQVKISGKTMSCCYICDEFAATTLLSDVSVCAACKSSVAIAKRPTCKCGKPYSDREGCLYTYDNNQRSASMAYLCKDHCTLFIGGHYTFDQHLATNKIVSESASHNMN